MEEIHSEEVTEATLVSVDNDASPEKATEAKKVPAILKLFSVQNRKKTIAAIAVVLVIAIAAGCLIYRGSPKNVAVRYVKAYEFSDYVAEHKVMAYDTYAYFLGDMSEEEYFEQCSDRYDEDIQSWKDLSDYYRTDWEEFLEDIYGEYKLSIEASRVKDMSNKRLEAEYGNFLNELETKIAFDRDDISDAKEVTVKLKIEGEDGTDRETYIVCLVKINGVWKALGSEYGD